MISNPVKDAIFVVVDLFCCLYLLTKVPKINNNMFAIKTFVLILCNRLVWWEEVHPKQPLLVKSKKLGLTVNSATLCSPNATFFVSKITSFINAPLFHWINILCYIYMIGKGPTLLGKMQLCIKYKTLRHQIWQILEKQTRTFCKFLRNVTAGSFTDNDWSFPLYNQV